METDGLVGGRGSGEGVWGEGRVRSLAVPGLLGGLAGALRAQERAVILTAVQSLRLLVRRGASTEGAALGLSAPRGWFGGGTGAFKRGWHGIGVAAMVIG